jgi:hypothetical protein
MSQLTDYFGASAVLTNDELTIDVTELGLTTGTTDVDKILAALLKHIADFQSLPLSPLSGTEVGQPTIGFPGTRTIGNTVYEVIPYNFSVSAYVENSIADFDPQDTL